jgi:hypothetical protein
MPRPKRPDPLDFPLKPDPGRLQHPGAHCFAQILQIMAMRRSGGFVIFGVIEYFCASQAPHNALQWKPVTAFSISKRKLESLFNNSPATNLNKTPANGSSSNSKAADLCQSGNKNPNISHRLLKGVFPRKYFMRTRLVKFKKFWSS